MPNPNAAQALYPHLPSSTPTEVQQPRLRPSLSSAMYQKAAAKDELRAREREALWQGAVEAGIKMQARMRSKR
jgi:hypothetical protein